MPTPFFRPTISAASTAIQAAKKLMRSMVNTCGSTAGKITRAHTCALRGAEAARGLDQARIDRLHRRDGRDREQEVDAGEHHEDRGRVADAEQR